MNRSFRIYNLRKAKKLYLMILIMFFAITNYAFIHHMVFESHGIEYHIVKDKKEVHDHCTVCKITEQSIDLLTNNYIPLENSYSLNLIDFKTYLRSAFLVNIQLRGPPTV